MKNISQNMRFFYRHDTITRHTRLNMLYDSENIIQDISIVHVSAIGYYIFNRKSDIGSWKWKSYMIFLISEGNFFLSFHGTHYHLVPGDMILGRPGTVPDQFCLEECEYGKIRALLISPGHHVRIFAENDPLAMKSHFHPGNFAELNSSFNRIEASLRDGILATADPFETRRKVSCLTYELFTLILKDARTESGDPVSRIINYMQRNMTENINLASLEKTFHIERHTLTRMFRKKNMGAPMSVFRMIRLEYSTRLLKSSSDPISEIAVLCGFSSPIVYSRIFLKSYGLSPGAYRKKYSIKAGNIQYFHEKTTGKRKKKDGQIEILEALNRNPHLTCQELAKETGLSVHGVSWNLQVLKQQNKIVRIGSSRNGTWQIIVEYRL